MDFSSCERQTAAEVLAAAVLDLFPQSLLVSGQSTPLGFFYDFVFPFVFIEDFLPLIEDRMRALFKKKTTLQELQMVPASAAALLRHHNQPLKAEQIEGSTDVLVSLCKMDSFVDLCTHPFAESIEKSLYLKLCDFYEVDQEKKSPIVRILGVIATDKPSLKKLLENKKHLKPKDHVQIGKELDLFSRCEEEENLWRWHPKGEKIRTNLLHLWQQEHHKRKFHFVSTPKISSSHLPSQKFLEAHLPLHRFKTLTECSYLFSDTEHPTKERGMLTTSAFFATQSHIFCKEEELLQECISSLQSIIKILKILDFDYQLVVYPMGTNSEMSQPYWKKSVQLLKKALSSIPAEFRVDQEKKVAGGPMVAAYIEDGLGCLWDLSFLKLDCVQYRKFGLSAPVIMFSLLSSLERCVALLLESNKQTGLTRIVNLENQ